MRTDSPGELPKVRKTNPKSAQLKSGNANMNIFKGRKTYKNYKITNEEKIIL